MTTSNSKQVSIIGLGKMGQKLAQLYVDAGYEVIVWNRTQGKTSQLSGVSVAASAEEAIRSTVLSIVCVHDNRAVQEILDSLSNKEGLEGNTIVNLTTGSPSEAADLEALLKKYGIHYINGAIQAAPDQMGLLQTTILLAGDSQIFLGHKNTLEIIAGNLRHLGEKAAASPAMDMAALTCLYGSFAGLIYGVKMCQAFGISLEDYSRVIAEITPEFTSFFTHELQEIKNENYEITQSPLAISVSATQRIADTFQELKVAQEFPRIIASILKKAEQRGLADKELAAIIKVIEED
ncbi:NAD(P)-dependent oxidoreductase [Desertivirga brevis]|uniref:NAD(P)-dependent oxidoreductase n=1 Tax=Desertivirga brevis TaxID=2810310 RepID=UPI001A95D7DE|nr:NAD(P)-binding domain-containing protein [Pedobacter sp. SYSU D00873]